MSAPEGRSRAVPPGSAELLRWAGEFYDLLPDPVLVVDDERRYRFVNRAACEAFQIPRARMLRKRIDDIVTPAVRAQLPGIWRRFLRRGRGSSDMTLRTRHGGYVMFETNSRAHFLPGLHVSMLRDVNRRYADQREIRQRAEGLEVRVRERTEQLEKLNLRLAADVARRRGTEAALRETERCYRGLFRHTNNAIMIFDPRDGRVLDANLSAARLYGCTLRGFIGFNLRDTTDDQARWRRNIRRILGCGSVTNIEVTRPRVDGRMVTLLVNTTLIEFAGRRAVLATLRDITPERQAAAAQRQFSWQLLHVQDEERRRVARDLHDSVSQLLATARFRLQSAARGKSVTPAAVEGAKLAVAQALREVRRISHGLRPGELDDLGFAAAVRAVCREFMRRSGLRVDLVWRIGRRALPESVEETLYRVLQESLTNVERHARARRVRVALVRDRRRVSLRVTDDGCGFPGDQAPGPVRATGIGLRNMQERAAQIGGSFSCKSRVGRGTAIAVNLPLGLEGATR